MALAWKASLSPTSTGCARAGGEEEEEEDDAEDEDEVEDGTTAMEGSEDDSLRSERLRRYGSSMCCIARTRECARERAHAPCVRRYRHLLPSRDHHPAAIPDRCRYR